jgi:hypothetical protein
MQIKRCLPEDESSCENRTIVHYFTKHDDVMEFLDFRLKDHSDDNGISTVHVTGRSR